jgi:hypothetical protein
MTSRAGFRYSRRRHLGSSSRVVISGRQAYPRENYRPAKLSVPNEGNRSGRLDGGGGGGRGVCVWGGGDGEKEGSFLGFAGFVNGRTTAETDETRCWDLYARDSNLSI